jgi:hypothetical protein
MHIKGHVEDCRKNYHPDLYEYLKGVNSSINEIRNAWLKGYESMSMHMNHMRYHFFYFIIFDAYNTVISEGKLNIFENVKHQKESNKNMFRPMYESHLRKK